MASLNKWCGIGNLGRDPEVRSLNSGGKVVNMTIACSEKWRDASGEQKERTEWVRISILNERLADVAEKYLRKGSAVYIEGKLTTRKWTNKEGNEQYTTEVTLGKFGGELVLLGERKDAAQGGGQAKERGGWNEFKGGTGSGLGAILDDEVPFGPCWQ